MSNVMNSAESSKKTIRKLYSSQESSKFVKETNKMLKQAEQAFGCNQFIIDERVPMSSKMESIMREREQIDKQILQIMRSPLKNHAKRLREQNKYNTSNQKPIMWNALQNHPRLVPVFMTNPQNDSAHHLYSYRRRMDRIENQNHFQHSEPIVRTQ